MCRAFNDAYNDAFNLSNIMSGFEKTDLWPLDPNRVFSRPLPRNQNGIDTVAEVEDLNKMVQDGRRRRREEVSVHEVSVWSGYLYTRYGCLLISTAAMFATKRLEKEKDEETNGSEKGLHEGPRQAAEIGEGAPPAGSLASSCNVGSRRVSLGFRRTNTPDTQNKVAQGCVDGENCCLSDV